MKLKFCFVLFSLFLFCMGAQASLFPLLFPEHKLFYPQDINGGSYWFEFLDVNHLDVNVLHATSLIVDYNVSGDLNVVGDVNITGGLSVSENIFGGDNLWVANSLIGSYLCDRFGLGCIDMRGDPWSLSGVSFEIGEGLNVVGDTNTSNFEANNAFIDYLYAGDVNAMSITAVSFFGDGSHLTGIVTSDANLELDGGFAASTYLVTQIWDGGGA